MNNKQPKLTDYTGTEVGALFRRCVKRQDSLERTDPRQLAREWLFEDCKITSPATGVADSLICKHYRQLLDVLRTDNDVEVWHWLGHWLKSENLRDPVKFFQEIILKQLLRAARVSPASIRNARVVRIWLPYTEPLLRRMKWRQQEQERNLVIRWEPRDYNFRAVELANSENWHSAEEFTFSWIGHWSQTRAKKYQRDTLANSYSNCVAKWWIRFSSCSFCPRHATGEFWVREEPITFCRRHRPDMLPEKSSDAWPDQKGRRWWREAVDVYFTPSTSP